MEKPTRHPIDWQNPDFYDSEKLDAELRRVSDICHGCRRCFNLCDSFPRLFDLIDGTPDETLDQVPSSAFAQVVDACTLCDMCFMTKCPYVPPHEFDLDFPHLMLRYKAVEFQQGKVSWIDQQLTKTDRNGRLVGPIAPLANWASKENNKLTRPILEKTVGIDARAAVPKFQGDTLMMRAKRSTVVPNPAGLAQAEKLVLFATCFCNYNNPSIGEAAQRVLSHYGATVELAYPECCGMPQLEHGDIAAVAAKAQRVAEALTPWLDKGYRVVALVPSCALMLKFEWPLICPQETAVQRLAAHTLDVSEAVVALHRQYGAAPGLQSLGAGVTVHIACHARAQNMGRKAAEMLHLIPETKVDVVERCSGHGGSWGMMVDHFDVALKVGRPVASQALQANNKYVASECPLAGMHIAQGMGVLNQEAAAHIETVGHPIELLARAYSL